MPAKRIRIIFVDDEPNILDSLQRSLRKKRQLWDMCFVTSGKAVLKLCEESHYQVVVTDLMMPEMNGIELVKTLNQKYPNIHCIMLTGTADLQDAAELINTTKIFRFYNKPFQADAIADSISQALSQTTAEHVPPSLELLSNLFKLTRSEARLTQAIVLGKSLEIAEKERGITLSSARTYLKRIFAKTETNRQAELVSKILLATSIAGT